MTRKTAFSFFAALLFSAGLSNAQDATCYSPDGSVMDNDAPCSDPSTGIVACCPKDTYCMQQGLCLGDVISRGSCTDKSWESEACSPWCKNVYGNNGCGIVLYRDNPERLFCCAPPYNAASSDQTCFGLDGNNGTGFPFPATGQPWPNITGFANASYGNLLPWLTVSNTATSLNGSSLPSNGSLTLNPQPSVTPEPDHTGRNVGIGVGVALGVLFLLAAGFAVWQMRRVSQLQRQLNEKLNGSSQDLGGWYAQQSAYSSGAVYKPAPQHELDVIHQPLYELPSQPK